MLVTTFFVLLPFIAVSMISENYKRLESNEFGSRYGTLTEGAHLDGNIEKAYYYPLFLF